MDISFKGKCVDLILGIPREKCRGIPEDELKEFMRTGKFNSISKGMPDARKGIKNRVTWLTRIGIKDPVLPYFIDEHNAKLDEKAKNVTADAADEKARKAIDEFKSMAKKCRVGVGKVTGNWVHLNKTTGNFEGTLSLEFPDGSKGGFPWEGKKVPKFAITHLGVAVDSANRRNYLKYAKALKEGKKNVPDSKGKSDERQG